MRYLILPLTYGLCLHYMLEASRMESLHQLTGSECRWFCILVAVVAVTVTIGRVIVFLDDLWLGGRHD